MPIPFFKLRHLLSLIAVGALLAGCSLGPATDSNPANKLYRCDRNGIQEERQAC